VRNYGIYIAKRFGLFVLVVFVGISLTFLITHLTPIDPVEQMIASMTAFGDTSPEAVEMMRAALRELYGVEGNLFEQYLNYWRRMLTLISWSLGNLLGGLSGYYRDNRTLGAVGIVAMALHPVPYYIIAFILLLIFGFLWPVLPISGGAGQNVGQAFTPTYIASVARHSILPALSIVLVGVGGWFLGMRALVSNIVTEDYVAYAELAGVSRRRILMSYVMRNALVPQVTGLAMSLGGIFTGAIIVEQVFGYPGLGRLLVGAVYSADYSLVLGVTAISIFAVAGAVFLIDILYPLFDPRMQLT
jgi:peptide/nickel transport system permease protein